MKSNTRHTTPVEIIYTYRFDEPKKEKKNHTEKMEKNNTQKQ